MSSNNNQLEKALGGNAFTSTFCINQIRVQPRPGEIIVNGITHVLEPKVMALLITLCEHANTIISAEALFERVWPRSVYSPNSVRRNIALLRKLLCDEDKSLIKTHPKRGYSLQAQVTFSAEHSPPAVTETNAEKSKHTDFKPIVAIAFTIICLLSTLLYFWYLDSNDTNEVSVLTNLKPITSSNALEHYMRVSPDASYMAVVTSSSDKSQEKHIVIRDLKHNTTWQVSTISQPYRYLAWRNNHTLIYSSFNGSSVEFGQIELNDMRQTLLQTSLFERHDIDWSSPLFIDKANNLLYLANQNASEHSRNVSLYKHNLMSGEVTTLLPPNDEFKPYKISLSEDENTLAMVGFNTQSKSIVKLFDLNTLEQRTVAQLNHDWYFLTWHSSKSSLLLSNGSQLSALTLDGQWSMLTYSNYHFLQYIQLVKSKLYFIENRIDEDLYLAKRHAPANVKTIANSNGVDWGASLSPDETKVAYISTRNGYAQLFLKHLDSDTQTLIFENSAKELAIAPPIWHSNQSLISALNNRPFLLELTNNKVSVKWLENIIGVPLARLNNSDTIIYADKSAQGDTLFAYNLTSSKRKALNVHLQNRQLVVTDKNQLIISANNTIQNISTKTEIMNAESANIHLYASPSGMFFRTRNANGYHLGRYDYQSGKIQSTHALNALCKQHCDQLIGISDSYYLLAEKQRQSDILSLDIN
ncbi:winged helix-turn-helix domain-containing protein [Pseudoalteromonas sp. MMG022]|uniref:winged helix-turn-helix domain-containing protein n=1 Tax=Pseudoalteromonas sp. MMG022 TaxID=2909978 RepID=UPI001F020AE6|nr:winged helix-turn-helix domain-containing protein [Pseudoalteromonas sp. MMG022]MCF6435095.1 winged helix-turn-helix domain-containing protein [Pseudoalteromonas sp. MMG022]